MRSEATGDQRLDHALASLRPSKGKRLTIHLVANQVRGDSRVLKSAQVSQQCGHAALIIGITPDPAPQTFVVDTLPVVLVPMTIESPDRAALLRAWRRWDGYLSWGRALAPAQDNARLKSRARSAARALLRPRAETSWSRRRPGLLDISLHFAETLTLLKPQLVHVHDAHGLPAALAYRARSLLTRARRPRVLYDAHECNSLAALNFPNSSMHQAVALIESEMITSTDQVVTVSQPIADHLRDHYSLPLTPAVVHNCPQVQRDRRNPDLRSVLGLDPSVPLAVYSGWLEKQRGVETVVRALALVPDLQVALVVNRDSRELKRLQGIATDLGVHDRLHTAPYVSPDAIADYLATATFGVLPFEPSAHLALSLPTKYYEYAAARIPSIASNFGELAREIAQSGFGRVFQPSDSDDFAKQTDVLLDNIETYRENIQGADLVGYQWDSQVPTLREIYSRLSPPGEPEYADSLAATLAPLQKVHAPVIAK